MMRWETQVMVSAVVVLATAGCIGIVGEDVEPAESSQEATGTDADDSEASDPAPFKMTGTGCSELVTWASVPAEGASDLVPGGYDVLLDETGRATAWAALKVCPEGTLDGEGIGERASGNAGILVESPDGSDGLHFYQPWWITTNEDLHQRLEAQGWEVFHEPDLALGTDFVAASSGSVQAEIPWTAGDYGMEAEVVQGPNSQEYEIITWHEGVHGTLQMYEFIDLHEHSYGPSTITAEASSPAADLFGTEQEGAGLHFVMDADFTVGPPEG